MRAVTRRQLRSLTSGVALGCALIASSCTATPRVTDQPSTSVAAPSASSSPATAGPLQTTQPSPSPPPTPAQLGSVYCTLVDAKVCLEAIAAAAETSTSPFPSGSAAIAQGDCEVCFACICPSGYFVIWAPPGWKGVRDWTAFHVQELWDADTKYDVASRAPDTLPPFVLKAIPRGGPWTGRYVANRLHVTFAPGTSPADAGAFAGAFKLTADWSASDTVNGSTFRNDTDAAAQLSEIASRTWSAHRACSTSETTSRLRR
jgi:hypothetical protein